MSSTNPLSLGVEREPRILITALETVVEWMRYCSTCDSEQTFIADRQCEYGLIGRCFRCDEERIARYTRANSEAA